MSISKQHGIAQFIPLLTSWHIWTPCRSLSGWGWGRWGSGWWCPSAAGRSQSSSSPRWSSSGSKSENYNSSINEVWMYEIISLLWHDIFAATKHIFSVACLEISELQRCGRLRDDVWSLPQRSARLLLPLGRDNLHSGDLTLVIPQIYKSVSHLISRVKLRTQTPVLHVQDR